MGSVMGCGDGDEMGVVANLEHLVSITDKEAGGLITELFSNMLNEDASISLRVESYFKIDSDRGK